MAYAPGRNGNAAPDWVMGFQLSPYGIARDPAGRIYVTNYWINSISVFAPDAKGAATPVAIIRGSKTGLDWPNGIAVDSKDKIYVVNEGHDLDRPSHIDVYAAGSNGNVAPIAVIKGRHTQLENPRAIALDASGKIYVADSGDEDDETKSPPRVMVYSAGSKGNVAPITTISGELTDLKWPDGIALDTSGKIYVTNNASIGIHVGAPDGDYEGRVTVYSAGAKGNVAPVARIGGNGIAQPQGVAVDSGGRIYVTNECVRVRKSDVDPHESYADQRRCRQSVAVYSAGADGEAAPIATILGLQTGLNGPKGVMVSPNGQVHVALCPVNQPGAVTVYPANSSGDVKPIATITDGADTKLHCPVSIALDSGGQIYAIGLDGVTGYPSGTNHNVPPLVTIDGGNTQLESVYHSSIALDSQKNVYVTNQVFSGGNFEGTVSVFAAGSNGNVKPGATISFAKGRFPMAVTTDSSSNIYVVLSSLGSNKGSIAVYPAGSDGNIAPIATVSSVNLGRNFVSKNVVSLDSLGRIYVLNSGTTPPDDGSMEVYPTLAKLRDDPDYPNVKPVAAIVGVTTKIAYPQAIALDSMDRIYVLNWSLTFDSYSITVYPPLGNRTGKFDETPLVTIAGPDTKLDMDPMAIAVWGP